MSSRYVDGSQSGEFSSLDPKTTIQNSLDGKIQYMNHSESGSAGYSQNAIWKFTWKAGVLPEDVVFHIAANAANGDDSEFGDHIYVKELRKKSKK